MNTKLKDILLYSFAAIGVCSLFIAATNSPQQTTSTVPASHVWEMHSASNNTTSHVFAINKVTGEVVKQETKFTHLGSSGVFGHNAYGN
jgi:hypothetical protein|tara:strand:+ start:128 stop:394 length:267 start_codon:yes stop_codon:yes gene_type:complete